MTNKQRRQYYRQYSIFQQKQEKFWFPKIYKALRANNDAFAEYLLKNGAISALAMIDSIVSMEGIMDVLSSLYVSVGLKRARIVNREIKTEEQKAATLGFNEQMTRDIQRYFELYLLNKSVIPITNTQKELIRKILAQGVEEGWGAEQMARAIQGNPHTRKQARVVVRTETVRASNAAAEMAAMRSEYILDKEWISAHDDRVRRPPKSQFDHWDLDGQIVPWYRPFFSGGEELQFPGDPAGSAGNIIQCRCCTAYQKRRGPDGEFMKKPTNIAFIQAMPSNITQTITI